MSVVEYVRRKEMDTAIQGEKVERRKELRRTQDRLDKLELRHKHLANVVVGERGDNGLVSTVKVHATIITRNERALWFILTIVIGLAVKTLAV